MPKALFICFQKFPGDFLTNYKEYFYRKDGYLYLCEVGNILVYLKRLGYEVDYFSSSQANKANVDPDKYDKIFYYLTDPFSIACDMHYPNLIRKLVKNLHKTIRVEDDPVNIKMDHFRYKIDRETFKARMSTDFNRGRFKLETDEDIDNMADFYFGLIDNCPFIIPTYIDHSEAEKIDVYGPHGKNAVCLSTSPNFHFRGDNLITDWSKKKDGFATCNSAAWRKIGPKFKKKFGIDKLIQISGCTKEVKENPDIRVSESELGYLYSQYKFIVCSSPGLKCLTWNRTRFIHSAWAKSIVIMDTPESLCWPEFFNLDKSKLDTTDAELKQIAELQSSYILDNRMTDEDNIRNLERLLN